MASEFIDTMQKLEDVSRMLSKMGGATIDEAVSRIKAIAYFMDKYGDIAMLLERLKEMEEKLYMCREMLTVDEAAAYLNVSKSQIYLMTSTKEITHYKPKGKIIYIDRKDLDDLLRRNPVLSRKQLERNAVTAILGVSDNRKIDRRKKGNPQ